MHLFGFADINALGDSVHTLAEQECRSPPLVPLKLDDVLAFTEWIGDGRPFQVRVGFAFARLILPKEAAKMSESVGQERLRHIHVSQEPHLCLSASENHSSLFSGASLACSGLVNRGMQLSY